MLRSFWSSLLALTVLIASTEAGQGINFYACVYYATPPSKPFSVYFTVGGAANWCIRPEAPGRDNSVQVASAGLSCASVGYVERKASSTGGDTCATDYSYWGLAYTAGSKSGSTTVKFMKGWARLQDYSPSTNLCMSRSRCVRTEGYFSGNGPLYVVFDPLAAKRPLPYDLQDFDGPVNIQDEVDAPCHETERTRPHRYALVEQD